MATVAPRMGTASVKRTAAGRPVGGSRPTVRRSVRGSHQDARSIAIAACLGAALGALVFGVAYYVHTHAGPADVSGQVAPEATADPAAKRINTFWREGNGKFHYYYTDAQNSRMIDGGVLTVDDLQARGIVVPGQVIANKRQSANDDALAERFKAIRDHLN